PCRFPGKTTAGRAWRYDGRARKGRRPVEKWKAPAAAGDPSGMTRARDEPYPESYRVSGLTAAVAVWLYHRARDPSQLKGSAVWRQKPPPRPVVLPRRPSFCLTCPWIFD